MPNPPTLNGMNSAAAALRYWERKQDVVANNLANVSTDGFKAQHVFGTLIGGMSPLAQATSDLSTGNLNDTGNPTDLAIRGDGFLVVKAENGERYLRGGSMRIDEKHRLVNADGLPLLGEKGPIKLGAGPFTIGKDGEVTQNGSVVDKLRMEMAPKGAELQREGDALWVPPATRSVMKPETRDLRQGVLEESNVNSITSMIDMVAIQRSFAAVQKSIQELDRSNQTVTTEIAKPL
jgi:flagellar basal body rod protein FlgG